MPRQDSRTEFGSYKVSGSLSQLDLPTEPKNPISTINGG